MTNPIELEMILRKNREEAAAVARDIKQACSRICSAFILGILTFLGKRTQKLPQPFTYIVLAWMDLRQ